MPPENQTRTLSQALELAKELEVQRHYEAAARILENALSENMSGSTTVRFQALLLRADLAISLNDLGEARGILAEAGQVPLSPQDRESLASDLRRFDDLEVFLTHRGCAG
jgi:hypothetical protein